jgi:hypothetical protein
LKHSEIAKSLSQKNESENENNFTQMSNHLKYEDPTLSNQQAASATQLLQNGGNSKSILLSTNVLILSFHHFEVVEWHLPPAGLIMLDLHISNDLTFE